MPRAARDVGTNLERKGFLKRDSKDAYYHLYVAGKKTAVFTKVSHGEKQIHDGLLGAMARQLRLPKQQFLALVDCPLTQEQYLTLLRAGGHIA